MDAVDALKQELGFAEVEPELKRLIGVYRQLQTLEKQARLKPASYLAKYRSTLTRSIEQVRTNTVADTPLDPDSSAAKDWFSSFIAWADEQWRGFKLDEISARRHPSNVYAWIQQHFPALYKNRMTAEERADKHLTIRNLEMLKASELALLKTYRDAIDGEGRTN